MAMSEFTRDRSRAIPLPALTVEAAIYIALGLVALFMRVLALGDAPLDAEEARQALASWNFLHGIPDAFTGSPLLFAGNVLGFLLFGANDTTARFLPALFGVLLVGLPAFLRRELGRTGALIASALFVFSPALVLFSRNVNGAVIAVTCALAAFAFGWRYVNDRVPTELNCAAIFTAFALLASPEVWTIALALALIALLARALGLRPLQDLPLERKSPPAILFALIFFGVGTLFLLHREGLGAAFDLFGAWLDGLQPGLAFYDPLRLLVIYDPIPLFVGVAALVALGFGGLEERARAFFNVLAFWIIVAFVLYSLGADKHPARVVVLVVPLALVASWYIGAWLERAAQDTDPEFFLTQELPVFLFACVIGAFLYLMLAEFATRGTVFAATVLAAMTGGTRTPELDGWVVLGLLALSLAAVTFLMIATAGFARAKVIGLALGLTLLGMWTFRQSAMLNFPAGAELNPREYLVARAASANVRDFERDLRSVSRWRANDSTTLVIAVDETLGAQVAWALRDFRYASFAARTLVTQDVQAVLLPAAAPAPANHWVGQTYTLEARRNSSLQPNILVRWLLFRDTGISELSNVTLWMPAPIP